MGELLNLGFDTSRGWILDSPSNMNRTVYEGVFTSNILLRTPS